MTSTSSATARQAILGGLDTRTELIAEQARNEERRRIARDLHDDISQQLALLAIELHLVRQQIATSHPGVSERLDAILARTQEIGSSVRHVSHQLHASRLGELGPAIRGWCQQIAAHYDIDVRVVTDRVPSSLQAALALALFRIVQEALHNIVKHSGARHVTVEIAGPSEALSEGLSLRIFDDGRGFDVKTIGGSSIGLASMRERLEPFDGRLSIRSTPSLGTGLEVSVPIWREERAAA